MSASTFIRSARRRKNLGQRELGRRARISQSQLSLIESDKQNPAFETVEKILKSAGHRLVAIPTSREDAASVAVEIADALKNSRPERALRWFIQLNDNLASEHGALRFALSIAEPESTGTKHWDAAIAALVAYRLGEEGLPSPEWVTGDSRSLKRSWSIGDGTYGIRPELDRVPPEFLKRRVLIDADTLRSA